MRVRQIANEEVFAKPRSRRVAFPRFVNNESTGVPVMSPSPASVPSSPSPPERSSPLSSMQSSTSTDSADERYRQLSYMERSSVLALVLLYQRRVRELEKAVRQYENGELSDSSSSTTPSESSSRAGGIRRLKGHRGSRRPCSHGSRSSRSSRAAIAVAHDHQSLHVAHRSRPKRLSKRSFAPPLSDAEYPTLPPAKDALNALNNGLITLRPLTPRHIEQLCPKSVSVSTATTASTNSYSVGSPAKSSATPVQYAAVLRGEPVDHYEKLGGDGDDGSSTSSQKLKQAEQGDQSVRAIPEVPLRPPMFKPTDHFQKACDALSTQLQNCKLPPTVIPIGNGPHDRSEAIPACVLCPPAESSAPPLLLVPLCSQIGQLVRPTSEDIADKEHNNLHPLYTDRPPVLIVQSDRPFNINTSQTIGPLAVPTPLTPSGQVHAGQAIQTGQVGQTVHTSQAGLTGLAGPSHHVHPHHAHHGRQTLHSAAHPSTILTPPSNYLFQPIHPVPSQHASFVQPMSPMSAPLTMPPTPIAMPPHLMMRSVPPLSRPVPPLVPTATTGTPMVCSPITVAQSSSSGQTGLLNIGQQSSGSNQNNQVNQVNQVGQPTQSNQLNHQLDQQQVSSQTQQQQVNQARRIRPPPGFDQHPPTLPIEVDLLTPPQSDSPLSEPVIIEEESFLGVGQPPSVPPLIETDETTVVSVDRQSPRAIANTDANASSSFAEAMLTAVPSPSALRYPTVFKLLTTCTKRADFLNSKPMIKPEPVGPEAMRTATDCVLYDASALHDVTHVLDIDGFYVNKRFYPKEICLLSVDNDDALRIDVRLPMNFDELTHKQRSQVCYVTKFVHGLYWTNDIDTSGAKMERLLYDRKNVPTILRAALREHADRRRSFLDPDPQVLVAYKGGTLERNLLASANIPCLDLELYGCPRFETLIQRYDLPVPTSSARIFANPEVRFECDNHGRRPQSTPGTPEWWWGNALEVGFHEDSVASGSGRRRGIRLWHCPVEECRVFASWLRLVRRDTREATLS